MRFNQTKVSELAESYINGNISYVKGKIKGLSKIEFFLLVSEIYNLTDNKDLDQIAFQLIN